MKVSWNQPLPCPRQALVNSICIFEMAAAYLFHIVKNHPFVDGNKRAGAMAAFTFLKLNQVTLNARELKFERLVRETAEGKMGKEKIAEFFQKNSKKGR
jgi:death on curing protein